MGTLQKLSVKDALSGLYNRRELFRRLETMFDEKDRHERKDTLVLQDHYIAMFDIDNFKALNDTYGHGFGDKVLTSVSDILEGLVAGHDGEIASRYGGEEFICILIAPGIDEAFSRVENVRTKVASLRWEEQPELCVTISGGIIACEAGIILKETMKKVDELLYRAKNTGKNRICRFEN